MSLYMAHEKHKFLFEIRPDIFPQGYLTDIEAGLWDKFYGMLLEKRDQIRGENKRLKNA